jgi:hypothetical protein
MRALIILTAVIGLAVAADATAQDRVRIVGMVTDEHTGEGIAGVELVLRNVAGRQLRSATTNDVGRFEVVLQRASAVRIQAARVGYTETITPVLHFDHHEFFQVEIRMDPDAVLLAPLEVVARSTVGHNAVLADFQHRIRQGTGHYITRGDIEIRKPAYVSDLLAEIPGVTVVSIGRGTQRTVRMARSGAVRNCPVQIFLDGRLVTRAVATSTGVSSETFNVDDIVSPGSVEGIEVYRGLSTVPPEFYNADADCGVIAIWTRRGGR